MQSLFHRLVNKGSLHYTLRVGLL